MAAAFTKIDSSSIKLGMRFSAPVFFEDGQNMFLAEGKPARQYHLDSIARWDVPYLLTFGHVINSIEERSDEDSEELLEVIEEDKVV